LASIDENDEDDLSDFTDILSSNETTPETEMLRSLVFEEIEIALAELPPLQRDIFIQTEYLGLPVKEIAAKSGVPVNTLLSRKHNAVLHLRKKLQVLYEDYDE
jgi:RNA polymerase sigma factor (sigma-70 family)